MARAQRNMCPPCEASGDCGGGASGGAGLKRNLERRGAAPEELVPAGSLPSRFARMDRKVAIMGVRPTARYRRSSAGAGASGSAQSPIVLGGGAGLAAGPEIIDLEAEVGSPGIGGASHSFLDGEGSSQPLPKRQRSLRADGSPAGSPAAVTLAAGRLGRGRAHGAATWGRGPRQFQAPGDRGVVRPIDVDSVVEVEARALQVSEDERLARELQEEFSTAGRDANLARSLQEQEQRQQLRHAMGHGNAERLYYRRLESVHARIQQALENRQRSGLPGRFRGLEERLNEFGAMLRRSIPLAMQLAYVDRDFNENDYETLLALDEGVKQRGASQARIDALPVSEAVETDKSEPCSICLEVPVGGEEIRRLPCLHGFHKECIDTWLQRRANCPVCKASV
ncbi:hypothetical protein SELMODRAFT_443606 [Selaginella moellendorffii]|uniref:RING-type domain-containing protein n=1 Tax=Selaginella moellendorffii TaxID=88036 RepID=D8S2U6_SELML|nr:hypothetical protein SELMODRAFT_443606 [Selaginella moellendorffii]